MNFIYSKVSHEKKFFGNTDPVQLTEKYGTPIYVYNENILRERCRDMKGLISYKNFSVNFSPKANGNLELIKIIRSEGLRVDAMSPGEIYVNLLAGYKPEEILYISNNVSEEEFLYAIHAGVKISVDSVSQLELFGRINPGGKVAFRLNPGVGAGHHEKVVTAGQKTKFGIEVSSIGEVKRVAEEYNLSITGINQHIGSLFMEGDAYLKSTGNILSVAKQFDNLEFIDLGGGFGIPYRKQANQPRLNLKELGDKLSAVIRSFVDEYGKEIEFKIEPGRYIVAESGILLGKVNAVKKNFKTKFIGTDLGFNVLVRPVMYDSHHDIEIYRKSGTPSLKEEPVTIVGNICETGDIIAKERHLPEIFENDILGVLDSGAYGYSMSSNYNNRLRPAEVLIQENGKPRIIRKRDTLDDLVRNFIL
ncbi:MAG: diaminopimelate decarboxylase [Bacteroidetes bacterium GWE2_41_25]|nr:MAG: diaminopimelate decarboxylase [Bacteroidetes bacterium GWE2_41_25]OFX94476.1 MAG: diaminopimelate decarboxylase [Bacteroidetes bacterium GWC2_40_22]HBH82434.1 diaminopimelate decarboxylase [Bacteroidales bacterium]HCU20339.1 diaminopimelate decarboxylase [Bacteroidales bacterium]